MRETDNALTIPSVPEGGYESARDASQVVNGVSYFTVAVPTPPQGEVSATTLMNLLGSGDALVVGSVPNSVPVLEHPVTTPEALAMVNEDGWITVVVPLDSDEDVLGAEDIYDRLQDRLCPNALPNDCSYRIVGARDERTLLVEYVTNLREGLTMTYNVGEAQGVSAVAKNPLLPVSCQGCGKREVREVTRLDADTGWPWPYAVCDACGHAVRGRYPRTE